MRIDIISVVPELLTSSFLCITSIPVADRTSRRMRTIDEAVEMFSPN